MEKINIIKEVFNKYYHEPKLYNKGVDIYTGCNGASGLRIGFKMPSGTEIMSITIGRKTGTTAFGGLAQLSSSSPVVIGFDINEQNSQGGFIEQTFHVVTSGTAGDIIPTFASNEGTQTSSINKYSFARVEEFIPQP